LTQAQLMFTGNEECKLTIVTYNSVIVLMKILITRLHFNQRQTICQYTVNTHLPAWPPADKQYQKDIFFFREFSFDPTTLMIQTW